MGITFLLDVALYEYLVPRQNDGYLSVYRHLVLRQRRPLVFVGATSTFLYASSSFKFRSFLLSLASGVRWKTPWRPHIMVKVLDVLVLCELGHFCQMYIIVLDTSFVNFQSSVASTSVGF